MEATVRYQRQIAQKRPWLGLVALILGLMIGAAVLNTLSGPPRLPAEVPDWPTIDLMLRGSYLPGEAVAYTMTMAAWGLWFWIVGSLALRVVALVAESVTSGAAWARALRVISDSVTLPLVRRLVDGAVVAILVINVTSRGAPSAAAAALTASAPVTVVETHRTLGVSLSAPGGAHELAEPRPQTATYTVRPGDSLWAIAERFYGSGHEYPRLVAANVGREMPGGRQFSQAGVILPGWVLAIPRPNESVAEGGLHREYTVQPGDTLRAIAALTLGDEMRWPEIFTINRGKAELSDGRVLTEPDLIWPGLTLRLPSPDVDQEIAVSVPHTTAIVPDPPAPMEAPVATPSRSQPPASPTAQLQTAPEPALQQPIGTPPAQAQDERNTDNTHVVAAAGIASAAGIAALAARRRVRRKLGELPAAAREPADNPVCDGFVEAEFARGLAHRRHTGDSETETAAVRYVLHALADVDLPATVIISARCRRDAASLCLGLGPEDRERLLAVVADGSFRIGAKVSIEITADHDTVLKVTGLKAVRMLVMPSGRDNSEPSLIALGVTPAQETFYVHWGETEHVLLAGSPGGGNVVLTSLLAALGARFRPDELRLWTVADRHKLPPELSELPHQCKKIIDPTDAAGLRMAMEEIQAELTRRLQQPESPRMDTAERGRGQSDLVLVLGELADLKDEMALLDQIGAYGKSCGVRVIALTERPETLDDATLAHFTTRVVLRTADEEQSIRLLGTPAAADLSGGGEMLVRLDGRLPVRMRGYRISVEQLDQLLREMHEAYPIRPTALSGTARMSGPEVGGADCPPVTREEQADLHNEVPAGNPGATATAPFDIGAVAAKTLCATVGLDVVGKSTTEVLEETSQATAEAPAAASQSDRTDAATTRVVVRCFGKLRVLSGDRELSPEGSSGAQYKPWEILAFLAAQPDGSTSKERLLNALWPEVDPQRAGQRLSVALVRLRQLLAEQVPGLSSDMVRCERNGTCSLNTDMIGSDAQRFLRLCRSAAQLSPAQAKATYEEARALYAGDLLVEPLYEWVHEREDGGLSLQEHYREEYLRITTELARLYRNEGQTTMAVPLYKSILKIEPTLEDVVRELYRCYYELGDRSSLVKEDRRLRKALREAFGSDGSAGDDLDECEPERETNDLFERVLADLEARRGN
ncbi:MAG: LysM peptidoglycan-binding domain-containing protein [Chloroflexi bacterium]|nr:LysM peptidoglycan-binding domain-containing protein [Chloroflexota bacterium]